MVKGATGPLVTVVCTTFKNEAFIAQALDGILAQQCDFPIEVLVHDDASPDGTAAIIRTYAERHPDVIVPIIQERNIYSQGRKPWVECFATARGKYIALCEGDDYWTDPMKLQKQVDLLERDPMHVMSFHRAQTLQRGVLTLHPIPDDIDLNNVTAEDLLRTYNFITTASVVFRNVLDMFPLWFAKVPFGDLATHLLLAARGRITCMPDVMSVYRINDSGAWSQLAREAQWERYLRFYAVVGPSLTPPQRAIVARKRMEILEKMAHARYPSRPRRKWLYLKYLQFTQRP